MSKKKADSNCLHGMQCPRCNSLEPFAIGITTTMRFYDEGSDDQLGDNEWGDDSYCECCKCVFVGTVADFTLPNGGAA
jgi:hypothetical protein